MADSVDNIEGMLDKVEAKAQEPWISMAVPNPMWGPVPASIIANKFRGPAMEPGHDGETEWWLQLVFVFTNGEARGVPMPMSYAKVFNEILSRHIMEATSGIVVPK